MTSAFFYIISMKISQVPQELKNQVKELTNQGISNRKICIQLNIGRNILSTIQKEIDVKYQYSGKTELTPDLINQIKLLTDEGLTMPEIRNKLKISKRAVENARKELKIAKINHEDISEEQKKLIIEKLIDNSDYESIAEELHLNKKTILNVRSENIEYILEQRNLKFKDREFLKQKIKELHDQGKDSRFISKSLSLKLLVIYEIFTELGITEKEDKEKFCPECENIKSIDSFRIKNTTTKYRYYICKICEREESNIYRNEKYKFEVNFKLKLRISNSINKALKKQESSKNNQSILEFLPYSIQELKEHLENQFEPWMNWENHGLYNKETWDDNNQNTWTWQIDHIIPQSNLPFTTMEDENFKKCWSLDNLRPLASKINLEEGVFRTRH